MNTFPYFYCGNHPNIHQDTGQFMKYIRIFVSQQPEDFLKIIRSYKSDIGAADSLKKRQFRFSLNLGHSIKKCCSSSIAAMHDFCHKVKSKLINEHFPDSFFSD